MATFSALWVLAHAAKGAMAPTAPLGSAIADVQSVSKASSVHSYHTCTICEPLCLLIQATRPSPYYIGCCTTGLSQPIALTRSFLSFIPPHFSVFFCFLLPVCPPPTYWSLVNTLTYNSSPRHGVCVVRTSSTTTRTTSNRRRPR